MHAVGSLFGIRISCGFRGFGFRIQSREDGVNRSHLDNVSFLNLDIELKQQHVPVFHHVIPPFDPIVAGFAGVAD